MKNELFWLKAGPTERRKALARMAIRLRHPALRYLLTGYGVLWGREDLHRLRASTTITSPPQQTAAPSTEETAV